jgi:threonyl-tRNA synthetase
LDFIFKDATGREIQIPTVQIDFATPKRFGLVYTNEKGEKIPPVMVHRAILGSYERFMVLLIEHFAGAFPLWLSPVQVAILPVSEKFKPYANSIQEKLLASEIRTFLDDSDESLGKRIAESSKQKTPFILVVGEKEQISESVAVRIREEKDQKVMKLDEFIEKVKKEIDNRA